MRFDQWNGFVDLEEKALTEESDHFVLRGYAATFMDVDRVQDAIMPGAFKKCLDRMQQKGESLQLYLNHNLDIPIGSVESLAEDRRGLKYVAHMPKSDTLVSGRVAPQIKARSLKANSFGYKVKKSERRKSDNVRLLHEIDIFEISVVGMPANPAAIIENIKGVVPFQDLAIDKSAKTWDAAAAFKRLRAKFGDDSDELKSAFLYTDPDTDVRGWDTRLLIADVDDGSCVKANHLAIYRASAVMYGSRSGENLPEGADEEIKATLDLYYQRLDLESPAKSLSYPEFQALNAGEREARLRGLGISQRLAKSLLTGPRDADRNGGQRDADLEVVRGFVTAIQQFAKDL